MHRDNNILSHISWKHSYEIERAVGTQFFLTHKDGQKTFFDIATVCWASLAQNVATWERLSGHA